MPSCVVRHRPSSSKRPTTGMSRYLKKSMMTAAAAAAAAVHDSKCRPKSAPNLTKPMREVNGISSMQQRTSQQRPSSSGKANTDRPISATGLKIKTRMQALREAAQQQLENDKENIAANDNDNEIDDEIYDEEFDSDEDKVFENSIQEMQKSKYESQAGEKKVKKKRKKMKRISRSTITDSYDAMVVQRLCLQCKRKYFGDGKAIPSISSLDRHVSLNMRVKEIVGKREAVDLYTSTERQAHERRERNKKVYSMKIEKIEKFCSWECVKAKTLVAVPKAFRYEVFQLIDLYAGYIVN